MFSASQTLIKNNISKKRFLCVIALVVIVMIIGLVSLFKYQNVVYEEKSPNGNITVKIIQNSNFQPAMMGGREYSIIVTKDRMFFDKKLSDRNFWCDNDGAGLFKSNIDVNWFDDHIKVKIDGREINAKNFYIDLT